jgi:hypothetical protein
MKRLLLEWGSLTALALAVVLISVWVASYFIDPWKYQLSPAWDFHVIAHDGYIAFFNQPWIDRQTGERIISKVYDPKKESIEPVTTHIAWPIPGFKLFYCRFEWTGNTVWSLELSPLVPILLLTIPVLWLRHRSLMNQRRIGDASVLRTAHSENYKLSGPAGGR